MGYIIIDENLLEQKLRMWNSSDYYGKAMSDVLHSKADYSKLLEALQREEAKINENIDELVKRKNDIKLLMQYAK